MKMEYPEIDPNKPSDNDYNRLTAYHADGIAGDVLTHLRTGKPEYTDPDDHEGMKTIHRTIRSMDTIANHHRLKEPTTVYRHAEISAKPGEDLHDKGYLSTTVHHQVANRFKSDTSKLMAIHLPRGQKHIPSHEVGAGTKGEHVLPRGTTLHITHVDEHGTVHAEPK